MRKQRRYTGIMRAGMLLLVAALTAHAETDQRLEAVLDRVSEEAEVFAAIAPKIIARETLRQKARKPRRRFRLRIGRSAVETPAISYRTREIVSEYGFSTFKEAPASLHELRKVLSVDGRPVTDQRKAREALTLGITKDDDRLKKKMLRQFEKHGLMGAATDFGQLVLLFLRRQINNYEFKITGNYRMGADRMLILDYKQLEGRDSLTIFEGRTAVHARLEGKLWVQESSYVPLRITLSTTVEDGKHVTVHRGNVDYFRSAFGVILPASVRYEKLVDNQVMVQNVSVYSSFRMFAVEAEIKFAPVEAAPKQP